MKLKSKKYDVGVIVGRFQVNKLHPAHIDLLETVSNQHIKTIVFLGVPPTLGTRENPLLFNQRKQMIESRFPNILVLPVNDCVSNELWSRRLDSQISSIIPFNQSVVLYGGRESFIPKYSGKYPTLEFENEGFFSGTDIRKEVSVEDINSDDFRAGVISGVYNQYPKVYTTVDIAIFCKENILLGRKPDESLFRFIGGFSEPDSECFEDDAKREVQEETGVEVADLKYVCSKKVQDWRYRNSVDKIKTVLYSCEYVFGSPKAADDIAEIRWFKFDSLKLSDVVESHRPLLESLIKNRSKS